MTARDPISRRRTPGSDTYSGIYFQSNAIYANATLLVHRHSIQHGNRGDSTAARTNTDESYLLTRIDDPDDSFRNIVYMCIIFSAMSFL